MTQRSIVFIALTLWLAYLCLAFAATPVEGGDVFMYLALGRYFFANGGAFPPSDPFVFPPGSAPWHVAHEWLSYLIYYGLYKWLGFVGLILFKMGLALVAFSLPLYFGLKKNRRSLFLILICTLAMIGGAPRIAEKAAFFSDICMAAVLGLLLLYNGERQKWRWLIPMPVIFLVWVQLHPGFPLGLMLMGIFLCTRGRFQRELWWISVLSVAACLLNPLGIAGFIYPFQKFLAPEWHIYRQLNQEWMPTLSAPQISLVSKVALLLLALWSAVTALLAFQRKNFFPLAAVVMLAWLGFSSGRFTLPASLGFAVLLATSEGRASESLLRFQWGHWLLAAIVALPLWFLTAQVAQKEGLALLWSDQVKTSRDFPLAAIQALNQQPEGTVFAEFDWNSVICFASDERHPVVVHGHVDSPNYVLQTFLAIAQSDRQFSALVKAKNIRYFLLAPSTLSDATSVLSRALSGWTVVFRDDHSVLLRAN